MKIAWLSENEKKLWFLIFLLASLVYFPATDRPIRDAEAKYVEIPKEMLEKDDWITPYLDFVKYYTKPPLSFWIVAIGYKLFGVHPWVARSINILWAFFLAFLIGKTASHMFGKGVAPIASACFLMTSEVFAYSLDAGIEFALISCITASVMCFWLFLEEGEKKYLRFFYFWLGLGYLTKGFLGIALPLGIVFLFLILTGQLLRIGLLLDAIGILIFVLIVFPWTVMMSIKNPDFLRYFIINEHIGRLIGKKDTSEALFPTKLFLEHMAGEFFPWVFYLPIILRSFYTNIKRGGFERRKSLFLICWAFIPFLIFSCSRNKVDFYGMHVYPPLLITLSYEIMLFLRKKNGILNLWAYPWLILAILAICSFAFLCIRSDAGIIKTLDIPSIFWAKIFLIGSFLAGSIIWISLRRRVFAISIVTFAAYMCFFFLCTEQMYIADFKKDSMKFAADIYNKMAIENAPIFCADLPEFAHVATINFYTGKQVYVLKMPGDEVPAYEDRRRMYVEAEQFLRILKDKKVAFVIGNTKHMINFLAKLRLRYQLLSTSEDRGIFLVSIE